MHEAQFHRDSSFITLTYNDESLPPGGTLVKKHFQDFMKRLRKAVGPIRYFHCGEYGENGTQRPHYHALIFGYAFPDRRPWKRRADHQLFTSAQLDRLWGHGFCSLADLTYETAAYTARYVLKKLDRNPEHPVYEKLDVRTGELVRRQPEYVTMSLKPGIGRRWIEKYPENYRRGFIVVKGKKVKIPRYYDKFMEGAMPEEFLALRRKRLREMNTKIRKAENTPERLGVREVVTKARVNLGKRDL